MFLESATFQTITFKLDNGTATFSNNGDICIIGNYVKVIESFINHVIAWHKNNISEAICENDTLSNLYSTMTISDKIEIKISPQHLISIKYNEIDPPESFFKFKKHIDIIQKLRVFS